MDFSQPVVDILVALRFSEVIHQDHSLSFLVESESLLPVALLSRSVPDFNLDVLPIMDNILDFVVDSSRANQITWNIASRVLIHQAALADPSVAKEEDLDEVVLVGGGPPCGHVKVCVGFLHP